VKPFDLVEQSPERVIEDPVDRIDVGESELPSFGEPIEADASGVVQIACGWCGMYTPVGPACLTCGSPLNLHRPCGFCGQLRISLCPACHVSLDILGGLARKQ